MNRQLVLAILPLAAACLVLNSNAGAETSSTETQGAEVHLRWSSQNPNCDRVLANGRAIKIMKASGLEVRASLQDTGWKMRADVVIINGSDKRLDVIPSSFALLITSPMIKNLKFEDPGQLAKSIDRKARWGAALTAGGGGAARAQTTSEATTSGTATANSNTGTSVWGTYNGTTTTTSSQPDYEARRQAYENAARIRSQAADGIRTLESIALRSNTLLPGQQIDGAVFFDREKKHDDCVLTVKVGESSFEIPFSWEHRP